MKKITLFFVALVASFVVNGQTTLTHNTDPVTLTGGVLCSNDNPGQIVAWRSFVLNDFGVSGAFEVETVQFAAWGLANLSGDFPVEITLWVTDFDFPFGDLTEIASTTHILTSGDTQMLQNVALAATVPAGSELVLSVDFPNDGTTIASIATNTAGQTAPSYATGCGSITEPTDLATFNLSNAWVLNVIGEEVLSVNDNLASQVSIYPTPAIDVINIKTPSSMEINEVVLYDLQGRNTGAVFANGTVNVSGLSRGVYMLTIKTSEGTLTQKVIKK
jgi:hypothetical protein